VTPYRSRSAFASSVRPAANVGADKDSGKRQRQAIAAFAKRSGHELVGEFNDAAVSGADPIETRPVRSHARVCRQQRRPHHHYRYRKPLRAHQD
jgi:hypothetical protein